MSRHYLEIPTIAPELRDRTLWSTLAEEQRRILLVRVEVWRSYHPLLQFLAIGCLHPTVVYFAQSKLVIDVLVLKAELCLQACLLFLCWSDCEDFVSLRNALTDSKQLLVTQKSNAHIVVVALGELFHLTLEVGLIDILRSMPYADEVEFL